MWITIRDLAECAIGPFDSQEAAQVHIDYLQGIDMLGSGKVDIVPERPAEDDVHFYLTPARSQEIADKLGLHDPYFS